MSLEELWRLFPIFLVEHRDEWGAWYADEARLILRHLPGGSRISQIGSTAVPGIMAKPIVDIMVEVGENVKLDELASEIEAIDYIVMAKGPRRVDLNKGYTAKGFAERVFHLHLRIMGDCDELYFRDYLIAHPDVAHEYERLKLRLWKKFEHDRDAYTAAKSDFVRRYSELAKRIYARRYE